MILCEMALQNQFNYCLKIRKLKLRVTIKNLNQFFIKSIHESFKFPMDDLLIKVSLKKKKIFGIPLLYSRGLWWFLFLWMSWLQAVSQLKISFMTTLSQKFSTAVQEGPWIMQTNGSFFFDAQVAAFRT